MFIVLICVNVVKSSPIIRNEDVELPAFEKISKRSVHNVPLLNEDDNGLLSSVDGQILKLPLVDTPRKLYRRSLYSSVDKLFGFRRYRNSFGNELN